MDIRIAKRVKKDSDGNIISILGSPVIDEDVLANSCIMQGKVIGVKFNENKVDITLNLTSDVFYDVPLWIHSDRFRSKIFYGRPFNSSSINLPDPFYKSAFFFDKFDESTSHDVFVLVYNERDDEGNIINKIPLGVTGFYNVEEEQRTIDYIIEFELKTFNTTSGEHQRGVMYNLTTDDVYVFRKNIDGKDKTFFADEYYLDGIELPQPDKIEAIIDVSRVRHGIESPSASGSDHDSCYEYGTTILSDCYEYTDDTGPLGLNKKDDPQPRDYYQEMWGNSLNYNFPATFHKYKMVYICHGGDHNCEDTTVESKINSLSDLDFIYGIIIRFLSYNKYESRYSSSMIRYYVNSEKICEVYIKSNTDTNYHYFKEERVYTPTYITKELTEINQQAEINFMLDGMSFGNINTSVDFYDDYTYPPEYRFIKYKHIYLFYYLKFIIHNTEYFAFKPIFSLFSTESFFRNYRSIYPDDGSEEYDFYEPDKVFYASYTDNKFGNGLDYIIADNNIKFMLEDIFVKSLEIPLELRTNLKVLPEMYVKNYDPKIECCKPENSIPYRGKFIG